jgi:beta-N-acetylhexosaminidase
VRARRTRLPRPRTGEVLLLLVLVGALSAEVGLVVATVEPGSTARATDGTSAGATAGATAGPGASASDQPPPVAAGSPTLAQLVGQKLMVAMSGTTPSADLLGRIERGEVGGVILFTFNISTADQLRTLTAKLAQAAVAGGQPPLLIATDQEGGLIKRVAWAPPALAPPEMGDLGTSSTAESEGEATGYVLRCAGINTNLAPVADVPRSTASFMYEPGRTWSFDASLTANLADAFASGLEAGGNVAVMKHFPGLGFATANTDDFAVTIPATETQLEPELLPYRAAIAHGIPMIMLSNATYTAYDAANAAGWSHDIVEDLLRDDLGFDGVTITDSLSGTAHARGVAATSLADKAARAGTDMIMLTGSEAGSERAFERLLEDAQAGSIPLATLQASYARILALKATIARPVADSAPPTVAAPRSRLYAPSTLESGRAPVRTSWSASDPCAIAGYGLERRTDGSAWAGEALPGMRSTSIKQSLLVGSTYRYGVNAMDGAGNTSERATGPFFQPLVRQSSTANVTFSGTWTRAESSEYSGGGTNYASAAGATASYTFTGRSVGWVAAVGPSRGSADVYVDGVFRSTVSLNAASRATRQIVFVASWARQGSHTIEIVVLGTPGHPRIDVDAFVQLYRP